VSFRPVAAGAGTATAPGFVRHVPDAVLARSMHNFALHNFTTAQA